MAVNDKAIGVHASNAQHAWLVDLNNDSMILCSKYIVPYRQGKFGPLQNDFFTALAWKFTEFRESLGRKDI